MDAVSKRLACLIAFSAVLHATALVPLGVSHTQARRPFSPLLTVNLPVRESPERALPLQVATAPAESPAPEPAPTYTPRAPAGETTAPSNPEPPNPTAALPRVPPSQPAGNPAAVTNETAANPGAQKQEGVRAALPEEVSVRVQLLTFEAGQTPKDTITVQGKTYVFFKSPSLRRPAQPLEDTRPQYPAEKPLYLHGAVVLQLLIDEEGKLENTAVVCSNPTFEKSAIASIEHMRFTPAQAVSGPVKSYMIVEFGYGRGFPCAPVPDLTPSK